MQITWIVSAKDIKVRLHKYNFSLAMHGWEDCPKKIRCSMQKKRNNCKIDLFHQNKLDYQPCRQILVKLLKNSIKYVVSRAVLGALLGTLKVALVGTLIIQSAF